jgi:hypothetical protein
MRMKIGSAKSMRQRVTTAEDGLNDMQALLQGWKALAQLRSSKAGWFE